VQSFENGQPGGKPNAEGWEDDVKGDITIAEAAAPHSSLAFMFRGAGLFVFPLMLIYTAISYSVFRGKVTSSGSGY